MRIKSNNRASFAGIITKFFGRLVLPRAGIQLMILCLSIGLTAVIIFESKASYYTYQKGKIVLSNGFTILSNYVSGLNESSENIEVSIKDKHYKRLDYIKNLSRDHYIGLDNKDPVSLMRKEWVPAKITHHNKEYKVDIRVKGQSTDHWGEFGSFKVKVKKGETIMGMKRFALQHPKTRGFLNEWYFHQLLKYSDLIHLRYEFVNLSINGDTRPIYALEENFGKRLLENNHRKEGLIFRLSYDQGRRVEIQQAESELKSAEFLSDGVDLVRSNIESFFRDQLPLNEVFDAKLLARFYAIIDLLGNRHAGQLKNMRFYFNPSTSLIEPVGYDQQVVYPTQFLNIIGSNKHVGSNLSERSNFFDFIFSDEEFYRHYINELEAISNAEFLDNFFEDISGEEKRNLEIIYKSYPYYEYKSRYPAIFWFHQDGDHTRYPNSIWLPKDKSSLYKNQDYIRNRITMNPGSAQVMVDRDGDILSLKIFNSETLPLEIKSIFVGNDEYSEISNFLVKPKMLEDKYEYTSLQVKLKDNQSPYSDLSKIKINLGFLGSNKSEQYQATAYGSMSDENPLMRFSNIFDKDFLTVDLDRQLILFKKGDHIIKEDLIIPQGFMLKINAGTSISLTNGANFISHSAVEFIGTENDRIKISSDDYSGIAVINAGEKSIVRNVEFRDLSHIRKPGINLSGGVNFYESDVDISKSLFVSNNSEDSINVIRSEFTISDSQFIETQSDAIDTDFSDGTLQDLFFSKIGNDGIDISGGNVDLKNIRVESAGDKGISIGENSTVVINHVQIQNSNIGIAVKDKSIAYIDPTSISNVGLDNVPIDNGVYISNTRIGFAVYQKKPEFGPGEIHIGNKDEVYTNLILDNVEDHFIVEEKSFLELGASEITDFKNDVYKSLYPKN